MKVITGRLVIEPLAIEHSTFMYKLLNSKGWLKFIGDRNIHSLADSVAYVQRIVNNPNYQYWVFKNKETDQSIGIVTLTKRDNLEYYDIGFAQLPQNQQMGYAFEASKFILDGLIRGKMHTKILAITLKENSKSIRLLQKLGLTFEKQLLANGEELLMYSISGR